MTTPIDLQAVPGIREYFRELWSRRWFIWRVPFEDLKAENAQSPLGPLWHVLNPLFLLGIYYVLFSVGLRVDRGIEHYTTFLAVGIFFFRFTEVSALRGGRSIVGNMPLILASRFPRLILPCAAVGEAALYLIGGIAATVVIALIEGVRPDPTWLLVPGLVFVQFFFNVGVATIFARLVFHSHDIQQVVPHVFRLLFYASGVLFPISTFPSGWELVFTLNPLYGWVSLYRWALIDEPIMGADVLLSVAVWTVVLPCVGIWFFRQGEQNYGRKSL